MSQPEIVGVDEDDLMSLRKAARRAPRKAAGATIQSRARGERTPSPLDARRMPLRGLHQPESMVPLNVDVSTDVKALVNKARSDYGMPIRSFVAEAIRRYARQLEIEMAEEETA
jgi:hypothetical protein